MIIYVEVERVENVGFGYFMYPNKDFFNCVAIDYSNNREQTLAYSDSLQDARIKLNYFVENGFYFDGWIFKGKSKETKPHRHHIASILYKADLLTESFEVCLNGECYRVTVIEMLQTLFRSTDSIQNQVKEHLQILDFLEGDIKEYLKSLAVDYVSHI